MVHVYQMTNKKYIRYAENTFRVVEVLKQDVQIIQVSLFYG